MSQSFVTTGFIEAGEFKIRNGKAAKAWAATKRNGEEYTVTFERLHATRSVDQNSLYFAGYVKPLAEELGWTINDMHAYLKKRFLPASKRKTKTLLLHNKRTGEVVDEFELDLSTTTNLNKLEFSDYIRDIGIFAAELGVDVGSNRTAA